MDITTPISSLRLHYQHGLYCSPPSCCTDGVLRTTLFLPDIRLPHLVGERADVCKKMAYSPRSAPSRTGLPPDLAALLAAETSKMPPADQRPTNLANDNNGTSHSQISSAQSVHPLSSNIVRQLALPSATPTPPPPISFRPVNEPKPRIPTSQKANPATPERPLAPLAPAPIRLQPRPLAARLNPTRDVIQNYTRDLLGLPAEIRVEIYKLVLENVTLHILPLEARLERRAPHPLTRVSKLVRNEVLPIIHANCPIQAMVTDFNFNGMLEFMARIPPQDQKALMKNGRLKIQMCTTGEKSKCHQPGVNDNGSLRRWLTYRADKYRVQPTWEYCGAWPGSKVEAAIRRKIGRMTEEGKKQELIKLGSSIGMSRLEKPQKP